MNDANQNAFSVLIDTFLLSKVIVIDERHRA